MEVECFELCGEVVAQEEDGKVGIAVLLKEVAEEAGRDDALMDWLAGDGVGRDRDVGKEDARDAWGLAEAEDDAFDVIGRVREHVLGQHADGVEEDLEAMSVRASPVGTNVKEAQARRKVGENVAGARDKAEAGVGRGGRS